MLTNIVFSLMRAMLFVSLWFWVWILEVVPNMLHPSTADLLLVLLWAVAPLVVSWWVTRYLFLDELETLVMDGMRLDARS
jgi:hypothetical protein